MFSLMLLVVLSQQPSAPVQPNTTWVCGDWRALQSGSGMVKDCKVVQVSK